MYYTGTGACMREAYVPCTAGRLLEAFRLGAM